MTLTHSLHSPSYSSVSKYASSNPWTLSVKYLSKDVNQFLQASYFPICSPLDLYFRYVFIFSLRMFFLFFLSLLKTNGGS